MAEKPIDEVAQPEKNACLGMSRDLPTGVSLLLLTSDVEELWKEQAQDENVGTGDAPVCDAGDAIARAMLAERLELGKDPGRVFQDGVVCDFFVSLLKFGRSICLTPLKTAVIIGIMGNIFSAMYRRSKTSACIGEPCTVSEAFLEYKRLLLAHAACTTEPGALRIFGAPEARQLTDFVTETLFQHFVLYQCVLVCPQVETIRYAEVVLDRPLAPPNLRSAKLMPPKSRTLKSGSLDASDADRASAPASGVETVDAAFDATANAADGAARPVKLTPASMHGELGATHGLGADGEAYNLDGHIKQASDDAEQKLQAMIEHRDRELAKPK